MIKATNDAGRLPCAQPESEGPTRDKAVALYAEVMAAHDCQTLGDMAEHFARAVLARWAAPLTIRQNFIELTSCATGEPVFISRSYFDDVTQIFQIDIGTEKQRTRLCVSDDAVLIVRETPEEIFQLLDR
jgi:hypothetical protein